MPEDFDSAHVVCPSCRDTSLEASPYRSCCGFVHLIAPRQLEDWISALEAHNTDQVIREMRAITGPEGGLPGEINPL